MICNLAFGGRTLNQAFTRFQWNYPL